MTRRSFAKTTIGTVLGVSLLQSSVQKLYAVDMSGPPRQIKYAITCPSENVLNVATANGPDADPNNLLPAGTVYATEEIPAFYTGTLPNGHEVNFSTGIRTAFNALPGECKTHLDVTQIISTKVTVVDAEGAWYQAMNYYYRTIRYYCTATSITGGVVLSMNNSSNTLRRTDNNAPYSGEWTGTEIVLGISPDIIPSETAGLAGHENPAPYAPWKFTFKTNPGWSHYWSAPDLQPGIFPTLECCPVSVEI